MKIRIDMDLSPEEARKLMGLPDVEPMQKEMMEHLRKQGMQMMEAYKDPEVFMKHFLPLGIQSMEQMQKFMSEMAMAALKPKSSGDSGSKK